MPATLSRAAVFSAHAEVVPTAITALGLMPRILRARGGSSCQGG